MVLGVGGGGGGELAIDLNNGVKIINHSQLLELSPNLYLCKFCSRLKSYVDFIEIFTYCPVAKVTKIWSALKLVPVFGEIYILDQKIPWEQWELDYQVGICSLIPPAIAISATQDRANTSVWWKLPFSIFFIIYYVQSAIINKVCKPELWFLCSAHPIIVLYICMKFHETISNNF